MASLRNHSKSRFWIACFRDALGHVCNRSTKVLIAPPGESPKERADAASKNRKLAQAVADNFEEAARGNMTESQVRKVLADLSDRVNGRRIEFAVTETFLTSWLQRATATKSSTTLARYRGTIDSFLKSLGNKKQAALGDITAADVQEFTDGRLKQGRSPSTVSTDLKTLNAPFNLALKQGLILSNPVAAAAPVSREQESRLPFTQKEVAALLNAAKGEWKTVILLGAFAGLRLGDAAGLKWENVDLLDKVLKFRPSKTRARKKDLIIPLHPQIEQHLLKLPSTESGNVPLSKTLSTAKPGGRRGLSKQFEKIMTDAGIEQETVAASGEAGRAFNKKTFHSLRHFFVTELENAGIAPDLRQKLAGHSDPKSHGRYTHTEVRTLRKAMSALPGVTIKV